MNKLLQPIKNIFTETRLVTWPTPQQLFTLVLFTILLSGILSLIILGLDLFFIEIRDIILEL